MPIGREGRGWRQVRGIAAPGHLAAHGLTLWDVTSSRFERDIEQWKPILQWVEA